MKNSKLIPNVAFFAAFLLLANESFLLAEDAPVPAPSQSVAELSSEEKTKITEAAKRSVEDEVKVFGSFEIDHPETDELLKLTLSAVGQEVRAEGDGSFIIGGEFKDEKGNRYGVDLYLEAIEGDYELADAILVSVDGKPVGEGKPGS